MCPTALPNKLLVDKLVSCTSKHLDPDSSKILLATSLCCDEVNRPLEDDLLSALHTEQHFAMGGLAGFPFGGVTAFGAMAHHIPDNGHCVIVYGPHVGFDTDGSIGTVPRRGKVVGGNCCGSAIAAIQFVADQADVPKKRGRKPVCKDLTDIQQTFVNNMLLPYANRLMATGKSNTAEDPKSPTKSNTTESTDTPIMWNLPLSLFDAQHSLLQKILDKACKEVPAGSKIMLVGGIQINTPAGGSDYFLPLHSEILDHTGNVLVEKDVLLKELLVVEE